MLQKEFDASGITTVNINAEGMQAVKLVSRPGTTIAVYTSIAGETHENVLLSMTRQKETLIIGHGYTPYFQPENDKLAAHKVLAIEMTIEIPEHLNVQIRSDIASVTGIGLFHTFHTDLHSGSCSLYRFSGNARLLSEKGNITVYTLSGVTGSARSSSGHIVNRLSAKGRYKIEAESTEGDIRLLQTKK